MTSVIIRRVESRLEKMVRPGTGGLRAGDALDAAAANLRTIEAVCLEELEERLGPLRAFANRPDDLRPTDAEFADLLQHVDRALTACGALNRPRLGQALLLLSAMTDALSHTHYWPRGALNPAIGLVTLFHHSEATDDEASSMLSQLQLCLNQYVRHAEF